MKVLSPNEEKRIDVHSSIDQYEGFFAVYERGGLAPIEFDYIDYIHCIGCDGHDRYEVVTHPVIVEFDDPIGYNFPIGEYCYTTNEYTKFDRDGVELVPLDEYFGEGFYEKALTGEEIVNFDNNSALGVQNNYRLKVGRDYYLAKKILPGEDREVI